MKAPRIKNLFLSSAIAGMLAVGFTALPASARTSQWDNNRGGPHQQIVVQAPIYAVAPTQFYGAGDQYAGPFVEVSDRQGWDRDDQRRWSEDERRHDSNRRLAQKYEHERQLRNDHNRRDGGR